MRAEQREYKRMIRHMPNPQYKVDSVRSEMIDLKKQLGNGINIIWVALSAFAIGFFISKSAISDKTHSMVRSSCFQSEFLYFLGLTFINVLIIF